MIRQRVPRNQRKVYPTKKEERFAAFNLMVLACLKFSRSISLKFAQLQLQGAGVLDDLLGKNTPSLLERPGTTEKREFVLDKKYLKGSGSGKLCCNCW